MSLLVRGAEGHRLRALWRPDLGQVIVTARQIPEGDEAVWHRSWKQTAEQLHAADAEALPAGRVTSAGLAARRGYDVEAGA